MPQPPTPPAPAPVPEQPKVESPKEQPKPQSIEDLPARKAILELDEKVKKLEGDMSKRLELLAGDLEKLKTTPIWLEVVSPAGKVTRDKADLSGNGFKLRFNRSGHSGMSER